MENKVASFPLSHKDVINSKKKLPTSEKNNKIDENKKINEEETTIKILKKEIESSC